MDIEALISDRAKGIDASGIRRVFELGAKLKNPINLSIGQPDFAVPEPIKRAAIEAIEQDKNGYTLTQGIPPLLEKIRDDAHTHLGWPARTDGAGPMIADGYGAIVTAGTSGALMLSAMALLDGGDEYIVADPYFVLYPNKGKFIGAKAVFADTYPDFKLTAERVEPLINKRTKFVLSCSPGNPTGVTMTQQECDDLADLCARKNVLLISDEIYDGFVFPKVGESELPGRAPSAARVREGFSKPWENVLVIRGFGKNYGATGWRMGYAMGPSALIEHMAKMQQYTYVCAPSMAQWGCVAAFDADISDIIKGYVRRRDMVVSALGDLTELATPTGAFYAFVKVPPALGMTGTQFVEKAIERGVLIIPGGVFSRKDTHFRLSFAAPEEKLTAGLEIIAELMRG